MPTPVLTLHSALRTDVGRRDNNEDSLFASPRLAVVADGVGGASSGEVASRMVVDALIALDKRRLGEPLAAELRQSVLEANQRLRFVISCRPQHAGMASTLTTVALSDEGHYLVANIGDSRTYLLRAGRLRQLTRDQSLVQALLDQGAITTAQAREHPHRSVVLEALDGGHAEPQITVVAARAGDRLLLCSDGLSDVVTDEQIAALLAAADRDEAARRLVGAALDSGGRDNVSVVVADVLPTDDPGQGWWDIGPTA